jgi:hypothetical protein
MGNSIKGRATAIETIINSYVDEPSSSNNFLLRKFSDLSPELPIIKKKNPHYKKRKRYFQEK